jgi:hypothetical protein
VLVLPRLAASDTTSRSGRHLEEAAVSPQNFRLGVEGQVTEGVGRVNDWGVRLGEVAEEEGY